MLMPKARVIFNKRNKGPYFTLGLSSAILSRQAQPGQFVQVRASNSDQPLLRRPLSIHRADKDRVELLYEVVGEATRLLSQRRRGEFLDIIGPLGRGFTYRQRDTVGARQILIAGGMGVAPLAFLAEKLAKIKHQKSKPTGIVFIGARAKSQILCEKEFKATGFDVKIATDDGSSGFRGKVTELAGRILQAMSHERQAIIYACGPRPMLKEVSRIARQYNIPAEVSLEEHFSCGIGVCMGCVVKTTGGYKRVCKEGPVFDSKEIVWQD